MQSIYPLRLRLPLNNSAFSQLHITSSYPLQVCGVCSLGYGRGSAKTCHKCTKEFKGVMYFVLAVAFVLVVIAFVLFGIYLVNITTDRGPHRQEPPELIYSLNSAKSK